ncbi:hypothetical protein KI387_000827, partial [Taxus chinensis]
DIGGGTQGPGGLLRQIGGAGAEEMTGHPNHEDGNEGQNRGVRRPATGKPAADTEAEPDKVPQNRGGGGAVAQGGGERCEGRKPPRRPNAINRSSATGETTKKKE